MRHTISTLKEFAEFLRDRNSYQMDMELREEMARQIEAALVPIPGKFYYEMGYEPALPADAAGLVERLEAGLEGVTPGPWRHEEVRGYCIDYIKTNHPDFASTPHRRNLDYVAETENTSNARYIANCDPDTIRVLLSALKAQAAEIEGLRDERFRNDKPALMTQLLGASTQIDRLEAKLREAVEVMRRVTVAACESEAGRTDEHYPAIDIALAFLATMEKPHD
jgi:hypothetical protein